MALDARKDGPVYGSPLSTEGPSQRSCPASTRTRAAKLECRALRPARVVRLLRRRIPQLAAILGSITGACLVLAPSAMAGFITPESGGSANANQIDSLYKIVLYIAAVVFVGVEGALLYSVIKFRAKRNPVAAQIHGNTRLEIGWTVGAALILVVLTVVTFVKLPSIINPPNSSAGGSFLSASVNEPAPPNGKKLTICVQGRQFIWRYTYGNGCLNNAFAAKLPYTYQQMVVPAQTTVILDIQSTDVIHSWWIPKLGGKVDAVPGYTTYTWFNVPYNLTGGQSITYHGQCAQLCGRQHTYMTAQVKVVSPSAYAAWEANQKKMIQTANDQVTQLRQILTTNGNL
jgi:cytochrome c oxidase subunit II